MTNQLITVASNTPFTKDVNLESFRCWDNGYCYLFLTTSSVESQLGLTIDIADGIIRGAEVIGVDTLLEVVENQDREDILTLMDTSLNFETIEITYKGTTTIKARKYSNDNNVGVSVPLENIIPLIDIKKMNRSTLIRLLKCLSFPLDEVPLVSLMEARYLLDKFSKKSGTKTPVKSSKGFANAIN